MTDPKLRALVLAMAEHVIATGNTSLAYYEQVCSAYNAMFEDPSPGAPDGVVDAHPYLIKSEDNPPSGASEKALRYAVGIYGPDYLSDYDTHKARLRKALEAAAPLLTAPLREEVERLRNNNERQREMIEAHNDEVGRLLSELDGLKAAPSEEEIEAAAKRAYMVAMSAYDSVFEQASQDVKQHWRKIARAIIKGSDDNKTGPICAENNTPPPTPAQSEVGGDWAMPEWESVSKETQEHITKILNEVASCRYAPRVNHKLYYTAIRSAIGRNK